MRWPQVVGMVSTCCTRGTPLRLSLALSSSNSCCCLMMLGLYLVVIEVPQLVWRLRSLSSWLKLISGRDKVSVMDSNVYHYVMCGLVGFCK
uniref:Uncharacterized protein n=1 Tax=Cannabis sativa TaxID=3483 RepID=A0A803RCL4_CANSA